jgi:2-hydroxychromene-2-carboxylate isomerase
MMTASVKFWFEFGSTYSYLSAARLENVATAASVPVLWEPFLLGPIFAEQGWDDSPFNVYPAKGRYMWRDMERLCTKYGIPFTRPTRFPRNGLLAARIACLAKATSKPWLPEFTREVFQANFAEDREIGDPAEICSILTRSDSRVHSSLSKPKHPKTKCACANRPGGPKSSGSSVLPASLLEQSFSGETTVWRTP